MSLQRTVATPFQQRGVPELSASEFTVALSLDREWFSPDQAERLADVAVSEGLLEREEEMLNITFDPRDIDVPEQFEPDESVLQQRSAFERLLQACVDAGIEKQTAVAEINRLQADLQLTIEAAAALYGHRKGAEVTGLALRAHDEL